MPAFLRLRLEGLDAADAEGADGSGMGPAAVAALGMLGWTELLRYVAGFAQTALGARALLELRPRRGAGAAAAALAETAAAEALEGRFAAELDFGGARTAEAAAAIGRARVGGLVAGDGLLAAASAAASAARLVRALGAAAAAAAAAGEPAALAPLAGPLAQLDLGLLGPLAAEIGAAIDEHGAVRDSASDEVKRAAAKLRTAEARLAAVLRSAPGEPAEHAGRGCVATPPAPGGAPPRGVLLGVAPGAGGAWFVEPPAAAPLNDAVAAARAALAAAHEAVLWRLTGALGEAAGPAADALRAVVWLDCAVARARYGRWIGGTIPVLVDFPPAEGKRAFVGSVAARARRGGTGEAAAAAAAAKEAPFLELRRLRHPLLLGAHLRGVAAAGRGGAPRRRAPRADGGDAPPAPPAPPPPLPSPVPADFRLRPGTRAVVVTGPNAGGKTAALKSLGLAALAARAGLPLPAAAPAFLPAFDPVLADIGDDQGLTASLSTFSGHLARVAAARAEAGPAALVLLDELAGGTDPAEGAALGGALLRALVLGGPRGAALSVATTHAAELAALKYDALMDEAEADEEAGDGGEEESGTFGEGGAGWQEVAVSAADAAAAADAVGGGGDGALLPAPRFENAAAEFDLEAQRATYRLLWGVPGASRALEVAERLGLEPAIIEDARTALGPRAAAAGGAAAAAGAARAAADADGAAAEAAGEEARRLRVRAERLRWVPGEGGGGCCWVLEEGLWGCGPVGVFGDGGGKTLVTWLLRSCALRTPARALPATTFDRRRSRPAAPDRARDAADAGARAAAPRRRRAAAAASRRAPRRALRARLRPPRAPRGCARAAARARAQPLCLAARARRRARPDARALHPRRLRPRGRREPRLLPRGGRPRGRRLRVLAHPAGGPRPRAAAAAAAAPAGRARAPPRQRLLRPRRRRVGAAHGRRRGRGRAGW